MKAKSHSNLISCVIGLCRKHRRWPSTLADLGYNVQIIEQCIRTTKNEVIRPDVILATNQTPSHVLLIECKSGNSLDNKQIENYTEIDIVSFKNYVSVRHDNLTFDIMLVDSDDNHDTISGSIDKFPIVTFEENKIVKTGSFHRKQLNDAFEKPISTKDMIAPLHYYPFSHDENIIVLTRYVLRALVVLISRRCKSKMNVLDEKIFTHDSILQYVHNFWDLFSDKHKKELRDKIRKTFQYLLKNFPKLKEELEELNEKSGVRMTGTLQSLQRTSTKILEELEGRTTIEDFFS